MYGFTITYSQNTAIATALPTFIKHQSATKKWFSFGYNPSEKFEKDKLFDENDTYIVGIDGVILNLSYLTNQYTNTNYFSLITNLFKKEGISFVAKLKGEFNGFIFEKHTEKLYLFNNKTATKQVFYAKVGAAFISSQSLESIVHFKEASKQINHLNIDAVYNMLTFGGMIENQTLISDVYKLNAGEYLLFEQGKTSVQKYFDFNDVAISITNKKEAIDRFNSVFMAALKLEYNKDKEYNYQHIATLSGGLDSRMTVMLADKLGYKNHTFCFSQSGYADEIIAKKIAKYLELELEFFALDGGYYLTSLEEMVNINNGLQFYHGSAHYHFAMKQLDLDGYGLIHTGQIGDAILGGFVSKINNSNYLSKTISDRFIHKTNISTNLFSKYRDEEVFKLYQRLFNLTNFGSYMVEQHNTYLVSPFMDDAVISVALSIDPKLKYNQDIYLEWINKHHKEVTKFEWERTGFKPNAKWKTELARYTKKIKKEYLIATNQQHKSSMNPTDYWLKTNTKINTFYHDFFRLNITRFEDNKPLFDDLSLAFNQGNLTERAIVLTILELTRKFNLKV